MRNWVNRIDEKDFPFLIYNNLGFHCGGNSKFVAGQHTLPKCFSFWITKKFLGRFCVFKNIEAAYIVIHPLGLTA